MRIKRVAVHGFKTFARATEFVFDPGITAVVGPNGSGKSNIVDAVRWCLGEQSFSLLRSKKTSDVIFSGSDKRPRLSMAEVSLTLDNSNGEIPIDFAEVEITRRAYRDGDNEYLVNGQRVRLQDVVDLLAPTGLGKRTYSVVGQGLIDRALSMAPEERRALFEEAAGITGYQIKRAAAWRRLEATHQNLARVQDIIAELSPRLGQLRRQAERAREREQIARDLQEVLRDWYGYRWHAGLRQLGDHHAAEQTLKMAVEERQGQLAAVSHRIEQLRGRQNELRLQLADLHGVGSGLHRSAEVLGRDLAVAQERLRQVQERQADAQRELAPLQTQQAALAERLTELQTAVERAAVDAKTAAGAVDAVQAAVGQRQQERQQRQNEVDEARRLLQRLQTQQADVNSRLTQLAERRTTLQNDQRQQETIRRTAGDEAAVIEAELHTAETQLADLDREGAALQEQIAALEKQVAEQRGRLQKSEERRQEADRAVDRLQTRHDLLNRLRSEGAGYGGGVRTVLQAGRSGKLTGIIGTVASLVQAPPHLDKAIETALGGALQNVVVDRWADAATAIEWLKQQRAGRATFLPLDRLQNLPAIPAPRRPGILGNAFDLVSFDAQVRPALEQLLNRTWIAEDLAAARSALDSMGSGPRPTVVTLDGEIVRPGGAVTGGAESGRTDDSLLARERELRELPGQIDEAAQAAREAAAAYAALAGQIEEGRLRSSQQQQALADLARQERQLRQRLEEIRRRADRSRQTQRWQEERLQQTETELAVLAEQEQKLQAAGETNRDHLDSAAAGLAAVEAALAAVRADELLQELANRRAAAAETQGHLRSQQALHDNTERSRQSTLEQIARKEQQVAELTATAAQLGQQIGELAAQEHELSGRIDVLQAQIAPVEAELGGLEAAQEQEELEERQLQAHLRRDESAWNQAQLHLQRSEDALQQLRGEIEQDLGLVTLEQSEDIAYQPPLPWDAFVQQLPVLDSLPDGLEEEVRAQRLRLGRLVNVNPDAPREYEEATSRYEFLFTQSQDLESATADLQKIIKELDDRMDVELRRTFDAVAREFTYFFQQLFNGGTAQLELTDPDNISSSGIEIIARPPGKRPQSLALLSGGERSLAACALIFAILRVSPTPFCVFDEVDAALDEANIDRFRRTVEELSTDTQFIIVTHNRRTLEGANMIYGITMGNDGVSRVMSLRLVGDQIVHHDDAAGDSSAPPEIEEIVKM